MNRDDVEMYLCSLLQEPVTVNRLTPLGAAPVRGNDAKHYGYGTPIRVDYETADREPRRAVIHTIAPGQFGHEDMADRAQILLWQNRAFNCLPRHVKALDVAGMDGGGGLLALGTVNEFCLLTEYAEGETYARDLQRILQTGTKTDADLRRAESLAEYLAEIHRKPVAQPGLYVRRVRELVGHGECLMGITDSYPPHPFITAAVLEEIEHRAVSWRWRLKNRVHRLRQVHGDFHPWNILFGDGTDFQLLDRSRGEFGDPADDVTCLAANYIFFSLQRSGRVEGAFNDLLLRFWECYMERTHDRELAEVAAPYLAFRGLVMASPLWYPDLDEAVRRKLLTFVMSVLEKPCFDPRAANEYCGA